MAGPPHEDPAVRVAVLGSGNVGAALVEMLADPARAEEIARRAGVGLEVVGISTLDLDDVRSSAPWFPRHLLTLDAQGLVERDDVDIVVELIGGLDPARSLIESALSAGRPVVTANKALLATHGGSLAALAAAQGVDLFYEAAVAGAIPIIRPLRESLAGERISRVMGIVNGTTNFILTSMTEEGREYDEALAEAQRLGLAERDPSADVEGKDAAAKAAILASLAFGCDVSVDDVHCEGITAVRRVDVTFAERLGFAVKLLAVAELVDGGPDLSVRVHPAMVPKSHPLAVVRGAFNAVFIEGEAAGELMLYGRGAGGPPAASAVLGDLIVAARHRRSGASVPPPPRRDPVRLRPVEDLTSVFYVSIDVLDRPGVLASVAAVFGGHGVSIRSMEQLGLGEEARLVFITHMARGGAVTRTIEDLGRLDVVDRVSGVLRVIGPEDET
jgi:homoserine dehydrogenase